MTAQPPTDFENWLTDYPEEPILAAYREYTQKAADYHAHANDIRELIQARRRLAYAQLQKAPE